jgi:hypothetical protein
MPVEGSTGIVNSYRQVITCLKGGEYDSVAVCQQSGVSIHTRDGMLKFNREPADGLINFEIHDRVVGASGGFDGPEKVIAGTPEACEGEHISGSHFRG